jgi:hypothetical protein
MKTLFSKINLTVTLSQVINMLRDDNVMVQKIVHYSKGQNNKLVYVETTIKMDKVFTDIVLEVSTPKTNTKVCYVDLKSAIKAYNEITFGGTLIG